MSLFVKNGRVFLNGNLVKKNILIDGGKIIKITSKEFKSDQKLDVKNKIILPGLIDPHVHFRDPGLIHKENFLTGSQASLAGGVTTVLDMPNTKPPTLTSDLLDEKRHMANKKSLVNFGFHFGSSKDNLGEIKKVRNIPSVKIFMDASTGNMLIEDGVVLKKIMKCSKMNTIHAEGDNVKKALGFAESLKKKFYLCHASSKKDLDYVRKNGKKNVFVEVTPHHLFLTEKDQDNFIRMMPPLKSDRDRKALWQAIGSGLVDTVGTDHAPHTIEEKESENPPYGVPGIETRLPLLLNSVNRGLLKLEQVIKLCCENPTIIFKIKNKGFIREGFDSDLTVIDIKLKKKVKNDQLFTKCGWSPFDGWELKGWPVTAIVNGNVMFENGDIANNKIKGREVVISNEG